MGAGKCGEGVTRATGNLACFPGSSCLYLWAMAKQTQRRTQARSLKKAGWTTDLTRTNFRLFGLGLLVIAVGFFFLSRPPYDSFLSLTVAPLVLLVGYLVLVPMAILYRRKPAEGSSERAKK